MLRSYIRRLQTQLAVLSICTREICYDASVPAYVVA